MILNTEIIKNLKELDNNVIYKNKLYSYDKDTNIVIETTLDEDFGEIKFGIDLNTLKLLKSIKEPDISFDSTSNQLVVKFGNKQKYKTKTLDTEIPSLLSDDEVYETITVNRKVIEIACKFTSQVISKPVLTGVAIDNFGDVYATNSFKAYHYVNPDNNENLLNRKSAIIIPVNFFATLDSKQEIIELNYTDKYIFTIQGASKITSRLISGTYPTHAFKNIETINANSTIIRTNYQEMINNINLAKNVGYGAKNGYIRVIFNNGNLKAEGFNEFECVFEDETDDDYNFAMNLDTAKELFVYSSNGTESEFIYQASLQPLIIKKENERFVFTPVR